MSAPTLDEVLRGVWPSLDDVDRTLMVQARLTDVAAEAERAGDLTVENEKLRAKLAATPR